MFIASAPGPFLFLKNVLFPSYIIRFLHIIRPANSRNRKYQDRELRGP